MLFIIKSQKRSKNPIETTASEHRFRVLEPDLFKKFRYKQLGSLDGNGKSIKGIVFVMGQYRKPFNGRSWDIQSVRFDRSKWSFSDAERWFKTRFLDRFLGGAS